MSRAYPSTGRAYRHLMLLLAVCGILALSACKGGGSSAPEVQASGVEAVPVEAIAASRRAVAASYTGTTTLEARAESQVVAKASGVALAVLVEEGQHVSAGQPLVRLDPDRLRLAVAQAEAQMRKLENNYRRARQLLDQQLISANDVDQLKYDLENARAQYNLARLELSYSTVLAPISGVVASRSIKAGNFVQINTPIFRIVDNSRLEATLNVPERELETLKAGLPVQLQVDALPGQVFQGTVDRVATVVDAGSGTFRVVCTFTDKTLQPGMFSRIRIDYDQRADALVVPRIALLDDGDPALFVVRDGKAVRVPVKTGYADGEWQEIREGLKAGERVITAGKAALRDGSAVQVIGDAAPVAAKDPADKAQAKAGSQP